MSPDAFAPFADRMREAGLSEAVVRAFRFQFEGLERGGTGIITEADIQPAGGLPRLEALPEVAAGDAALAETLGRTVVLKLNGGLGTSMGLERAKSLLPVKGNDTFLDFIARQILALRELHGAALRFYLMNSFYTSRDTLDYLKRYPTLATDGAPELMQNTIPKVDARTLQPVQWPGDHFLEWCPPGHGDIYAALVGTGLLDRLLEAGARYLFVSNADNLGASLDPRLLAYFAGSDLSFLMEVAGRTPSDRKGGHLAVRKTDGRLILREVAQCLPEDAEAFQDITRHRYFNTNNLWLRLDHLREALDANGGLLPLPLIRNEKTVDPRDPESPPVFQLETAMGAAIECFARSGGVVVPRSRFVPVKTTSDLLAVRSDAYVVGDDHRLRLAPEREGSAPRVDLDKDLFRRVDQLDAATPDGPPSLQNCSRLRVEGRVTFASGVVFEGDVTVRNPVAAPRTLAAGTYRDTTVEL
jgi:UDP-N-acetylglucosamine pyrophosphorylase